MTEEKLMSDSNLTRKLADFTQSIALDSMPISVVENAKMAILDCFGVAVLAASQEIGEVLIRFSRANGAPGPCIVWGTTITASPRDAALFNGMLAHGLDYDDRNHASTYTLATSVALAEICEASGARTLEAFIAGREVRVALDLLFSRRSSGVGPGARGWHSNGILGPIASACSASKILGLDVTQIVGALGLAAGSCGALTRDGGTMAKPFRVGQAAMTGMNCALLAKEGLTADETALEGRYGLLEALGPLTDEILATLGKNLGRKLELEEGVRIKPFASCTATHPELEAMLRLVHKHRINALEVQSIECDLKPYPLVRREPKRGFEGRFSMPFCLAVALVHGDVKPSDFTNERLHEPMVQELLRRTKHLPGASHITVRLKNGTDLSELIRPATNLKGWDQVCEKFNEAVATALTGEQRSQILASVKRLEDLTTIRLVTRNLQTGR
jgi:2-methylcitrate dehydratase PrpD